jgi:hypothetical protein
MMDLVSTRRVGLGVAGALASPAREVAGAGVRAAVAGWRTPLAAPFRRPARALAEAAERRGAAEESRLIGEAAQTSSEWVGRVLGGPLIDRGLRALFEARVVERVAAAALEGEALERVLVIAGERRAGIRAADVVLADDGVERLLAHIVDQPAVERLVERVLASRFAVSATDQLLASEELRRVVGHVAASPEVRDALQAQTHGLVDDVSDQLRDRSSSVDDRMEGVARRLLRRHPHAAPLAPFDDGAAPA